MTRALNNAIFLRNTHLFTFLDVNGKSRNFQIEKATSLPMFKSKAEEFLFSNLEDTFLIEGKITRCITSLEFSKKVDIFYSDNLSVHTAVNLKS